MDDLQEIRFLILDIDLPGINGLEAQCQLAEMVKNRRGLFKNDNA